MRLQKEAIGVYTALTAVISSKTSSVSSTFVMISSASFLSVVRVFITLSSSRMLPLDSLRAVSRDFSRLRRRTRNSPCSLRRSERFCSMSGLSVLRISWRHWLCSELGVTVKLTKVTREQRSGVKCAVGSLVARKMTKEGEKSTSWSPRVIRMRPPCLRISLFSTGFSTGSMLSTSCTSSGVPKRRALSRFFMKELSRKEVWMILRLLYWFMRNSAAWPEGSMMSGYLLKRCIMIAFSTQRSSAGSLFACHVRRSSGCERYSTTETCSLNWTATSRSLPFHLPMRAVRYCWSKNPL
mmetsp:Transcript_18287/g.70654  ORF Transcript_18287/g.70654 Transcript_18287/m.70654 type:complete len:296 (-) Transcript_18287:3330-4217(-)